MNPETHSTKKRWVFVIFGLVGFVAYCVWFTNNIIIPQSESESQTQAKTQTSPILSQYELEQKLDSKVSSLTNILVGINETCKNPDFYYENGYLSSQFSANLLGKPSEAAYPDLRSWIVRDANAIKASLTEIKPLNESFRQMNSQTGIEVQNFLGQAAKIADQIIATQKCPKEIKNLNFPQIQKELSSKIFPCKGIC